MIKPLNAHIAVFTVDSPAILINQTYCAKVRISTYLLSLTGKNHGVEDSRLEVRSMPEGFQGFLKLSECRPREGKETREAQSRKIKDDWG